MAHNAHSHIQSYSKYWILFTKLYSFNLLISKSDTWRLNTNRPTQSLNDKENIYKCLLLVHPEQHWVKIHIFFFYIFITTFWNINRQWIKNLTRKDKIKKEYYLNPFLSDQWETSFGPQAPPTLSSVSSIRSAYCISTVKGSDCRHI